MKVLGIVGSPRRGGNTEILVDEVLRGAEEAGAQTDKVILNELHIAPCQACNTCLESGECIQQDDMAALLEKMQGSEVWVLGTPVYWWGPTAQFKAFLDRWYGADKVVRFAGRRSIVVIALGDTDASTARHTIGMLTDAMTYTKMKLLVTIVATGVSDPGDVRGSSNVLAAARYAGREAVLSKI
jgi:multimeric flavodoxin WrbA